MYVHLYFSTYRCEFFRQLIDSNIDVLRAWRKSGYLKMKIILLLDYKTYSSCLCDWAALSSS